MKEIILEGKHMMNRAAMHDELAEKFALASYYGRNLDALWDLLTERNESCAVVLNNPADIATELYEGLVTLLLDLVRECPIYTFTIRSDWAIPERNYRHFKGKEYKVLALAIHSESLLPEVVYQPLYASALYWVRPLAMWQEMMTVEGQQKRRFSEIQKQ